ncbi:MAG TPA: hypothetical protein VGB95_02445, partial [Chitinophagales bacterium]
MIVPNINLKRTKQGLEVWLSQEVLLRYCSLSDTYLRKVRCWHKQGKVSAWEWQLSDGTFFYKYDSIPNKAPTMYYSLLPTREQLIEMANQPVHVQAETLLQIDAKAFIENDHRNHFWKYTEYKDLQAVNLARACSFLVWAVKHIVETEMDTRPMDFFIGCCEIIRNLEIKHLPQKHHRSLKEYIKLILDGSCTPEQIVKLDNLGNANSVAHKEDRELIGWIFQLRASGANYTNEFIVRKVQNECDKIGKEKPSRKWIIDKINEHETKYLTAISRFGMKSKMGNRYPSDILKEYSAKNGWLTIENEMHLSSSNRVGATKVEVFTMNYEPKQQGKLF